MVQLEVRPCVFLIPSFVCLINKRNIAALHHNWKGIVYLWGRGGAFERNCQPERQSNDPDERHASKLTQDTIEKKKSDISRHTVEG